MSDKKNNSPEIFKWKENEIKQEFEKKWYDWEKVKSELEKIEKKEEIDKKLTELEWKTEDYVTYLEWLLKDKEKLKKAEPEKKWIVDKAVENWKKAVIEEAEKKWSFYGKIARFFLEWTDEKAEDTFFTKVWNGMKVWIWMAILWFFGIKWISALTEAKKEEIKESVSNAVTSWTEVAVSATERVWESVKSAVTEKTEEIKEVLTPGIIDNKSENNTIDNNSWVITEVKEDNESLKNTEYLKYFWGFNALLWLSWEKYDKDISKKEYMKNLENIKYEDLLKNKSNPQYFLINWWFDNDILKENFPSILNSLSSENTQNLLRIWLKKDSLEKILMWNNLNTPNEKIKKYIWEDRFNEILSMIKNNSYDYKKLTIKELSYFYSFTIPVLFWWALNFSFDIISTYLPENISTISNELKEIKEEYFSQEFLQKVWSWGKEKTWESKEKLISELNFSNEKDKQDFEKLFEFKNYIIWDFLNEKFLNLNSEEKNIIKSELKYRHIVVLYSIMWWEKLQNVNPVNITLIIWTLLEVIKTSNSWNSNIAWNYLNRYFMNSFWEKSFLTEDQKIVMNIYWKTFIWIHANNFQSKLSEYLWMAWITKENTWKWALISWAWAIWTHIWTKYIIDKWIQKWGLSLVWLWARRLIKPLWIAAVLLWWAHFALDEWDIKNEFQENLQKSYESWDVEKYISLINELENSIKTVELSIDWKKEKVWIIAMNWETPLIIKWKEVFTIWLYPSLAKEIWKDVTLWVYDPNTKIDWKNAYPINISWNKIIFWETWIEKDLSIYLSSVRTEKNWISKWASWFNDQLEKFWWKRTVTEWYWNYLKMWEVWEFWVWLVPLFTKE